MNLQDRRQAVGVALHARRNEYVKSLTNFPAPLLADRESPTRLPTRHWRADSAREHETPGNYRGESRGGETIFSAWQVVEMGGH